MEQHVLLVLAGILDNFLTLATVVLAHPAAFVLGCTALRAFYLLYLHPLSNVPGPRLAALTDLWKARAVSRRHFSSTLHREHIKHGDVVRIGPNEVSIIAPEDVPTLYGQRSEYLKGPFYDAWSFFGKGHFSDRNPVTHRHGRQMVAGAYSLNHLVSLERYCDTCTELLFQKFDKISESEGQAVVDISQLIEMYAYDCISGIGFGKLFGTNHRSLKWNYTTEQFNTGLLRDDGPAKEMIDSMLKAGQMIVVVATLSRLNWLLSIRPIAWLISMIMGTEGPSLFVEYGNKYVAERRAMRGSDPMAYADRGDMLYYFMETKDLVTSKSLDTIDLVKNCLTLILAGADTTRASMVAFLGYVYTHPPTLRRLREEMDEAVAAGQLTFPVSYAQAARLNFMWACMKEAMRLYPVVGMPLQRVVPPGGRVIGGRFYPAGTHVGMAPNELHCDSRAYGTDAAEWRPERWLKEDRNKLEKYSLVFGQGARVCLGRNISLMEMAKLFPGIVYRYDLVVQDPENPWKNSESWFRLQYNFFCSVKNRER